MTIKFPQRRQVYLLLGNAAALMPLCAAIYYAAYLLRFAGDPGWQFEAVFLETLLPVVVLKWLTFVWFGLHRSWTRYVNFHDLLLLARAVTCGTLVVTLTDAMLLTGQTIPRSIILIDGGMTLLVVGAARALPRLARDDAWHLLASPRGTSSLIVGASDAGETLLRAIRGNAALEYRVVGFVDDHPALEGCRISGVPVLGRIADLPQLTSRYGIEEVLIASGDLAGKQVRYLVEAGRQHDFRVKIVPSYEQLLGERVTVRPRPVAIDDLLCRPSVELNLDALRGWLSGRVVMVTGSAGSIGSEICRQLLKLQPARLVLVDRAETGQFFLEHELRRHMQNCGWGEHRSATCSLQSEMAIDVRLADLTDRPRMEALFRDTRPEIIFHAAAYKHVPLMEAHCGEAVKNIVLATRHLADLAGRHGAQALVMISSDKAVNPTSVMGACKRLAEQYVQARAVGSTCRMVTVRFGNVLDSSGSVVPIFREQIARGGPVTVTHPDMTRYFMLIPEAAQLVIQAGAMGQGGEIFVLDMGEPVRILDLAHDMIRLSGLRVGDDIELQITGLRPGEKLYEELYDESEPRDVTSHPKIMVATGPRRPVLDVIRDINRLEELVNGPNEAVRAALQDIVPVGSPSTTAPKLAAA